MPPLDRALTALLLTKEEAEVVQTLGGYRLTALLGDSTRYYPCPPWSERGRRPVLTPHDLAQSLLGKMPLAGCPAGFARMFLPPQAPTPPGVDRTLPEVGKRITLFLPEEVRAQLQEALSPFPESWALALLTQPDPEANVRLVWRPGDREIRTITPHHSDGSCLTGGFVALVAEPSLPEGARVAEDGFLAAFGPTNQARFREAISTGQPFVLPPAQPDLAEFCLEWLPAKPSQAPASPAGTEAPDKTAAFFVHQIMLYQPDEVLRQRVGNVSILGSFLKRVEEEANQFWSALPPGESRAVLLVVALRPGGRSRFWPEENPPGLDRRSVEEVVARLQRLPPPLVHSGPVAVALQASLWSQGGKPGGWPFIPTEWQQACGQENLLVPDGVLKIVWPE